MRVTKLSVRLIGLLAVIAAVLLAFSSAGPGAPQERVRAAGPVLAANTSCADVYIDLSALIAQDASLTILGDPPNFAEDFVVARSLSRLEPSQKFPGQYDTTVVTYLGDQGGNPIALPSGPPTKLDCQQKAAVATGEAEVTNHKLTWMDVGAFNEPPPWNRVEVLVLTNGDVKSMLFTCQNSGEKVLVNEPKVKNVGDETWSADFVQKCITETSGVSLVINWVGAVPGIPLEPDCVFSNTGTPLLLQPCSISNVIATPKPAAEAGIMDPDVDFMAIGNKRPTALATFDDLTDVLSYTTCAFSEASKDWIRTDVETKVLNKGPNAKNFGKVVLYLGTGSPTDPNDGTTCQILPTTVIFPSIFLTHGRDATTDFPNEQKNIDNTIATDPDGPTKPSKTQKQDPDSADLLQDDWDGDGCPDWDELDKSFINGRDPFNPNDCGVAENDLTGTYSILATAFPAAKSGVITGNVATVQTVNSKVIKDGKHIQADLTVVDPNMLKNNQKVYWDTTDPLQVGWWQVKTGSIGTPSAGTKTVTLNRLFITLPFSPCGQATTGIPDPATAAPGTLQGVQCSGDVQQGSYFHCLARIDEVPDNVLDGNVTCYTDAPLLNLTGPPSAVPSFQDGNAGPPPPPPYGTGAPAKLNGTVDANQRIILEGCFANVGSSPGPNTVVRLNVDAHSLKGFTDVWFKRTIAECDAKTPNAGDPPSLQLDTVLTRQAINFDHDDDGCSDYDELGHGKTPPPAKKNCGDDPFSPYDSDADANGVVSIAVTQVRADWDKVLDELIPGFYFHCIANNTHDLVTNAVTSTAMCYTDNVVLTVNCEVVANAVGPCPIDSQASVCGAPPFADASACGDGLMGSGPPAPFGDVDGSHTVGTGTYDKVTNVITIDTCFEGVESSVQGPNIYARTKVNIHTGQGTVQIAINQPDCTKPNFGDTEAFPEVLIETAEQPPDWDSDGDNCTDEVELGQSSSGGLRDPYNRWDWFDQYTGSPPTQDGAIIAGDIGAIVARFGAIGTPGDPTEPPTSLVGYHTQGDRSGSMKGSNAWNLLPPDGAIIAGDIGAVVGSFGAAGCNAHP